MNRVSHRCSWYTLEVVAKKARERAKDLHRIFHWFRNGSWIQDCFFFYKIFVQSTFMLSSVRIYNPISFARQINRRQCFLCKCEMDFKKLISIDCLISRDKKIPLIYRLWDKIKEYSIYPFFSIVAFCNSYFNKNWQYF